MSEHYDPAETFETADGVRLRTDFPHRWGSPEGEPGTPERRAWIVGNIKADEAAGL